MASNSADALHDVETKEKRLGKIKDALILGNQASVAEDVTKLMQDYPHDYECLHVGGVFALKQSNLQKAREAFETALPLAKDNFHKAATAAGISETLLSLGDPALAEQYAKQALSLHNRNLDYYDLLARCYLSQGQTDRATAFLRATILTVPPSVQAVLRLQIADILTQAGRAKDALPFIDAIEAQQPNNIDVFIRKATALEVMGNSEEASVYYKQALAIKPTLPIYYSLAKCKTTPRNDPHYADLFERQLAASPHDDIVLRTNLHFALAKIYDDLDDPDKAFEHLQQGNGLKRSGLQWSNDAETESLKRIESFFDASMMARFADRLPANDNVTPIFIVGMPRSGTTLVEQILSKHSQVHAAGELQYISLLTRELGRQWDILGQVMPGDDKLLSDFTHAAKQYRNLINNYAHGVKFVTDKMPTNFHHLGLIKLLFPDALLIHCRRDPIATCFSCYQQLFDSTNLAFTYDLRELASYYHTYLDYMSHWNTVLQPPAWIEIQYETLITSFENEVRRLLDYCNLPFEPECLDFHKSNRTVLTASHSQVRRPLYTDAVGKWRRYEKYLGALKEALNDVTGEI